MFFRLDSWKASFEIEFDEKLVKPEDMKAIFDPGWEHHWGRGLETEIW
jgi:hypothetical protein